MSDGEILLYGVGDIRPNRDEPESLFAEVGPTLKRADILFGHLETNLSARGEAQVQVYPYAQRSHPRNVRAFTQAGFHILSYASNHHLDWGEDALVDTLDLVRRNGISIVGVGRNIAEARQPAIIERHGTRVGFLSYSSVLPVGYEAQANKCGCAPMRVSTYYEQTDAQPGTPPKIVTLPDKRDLDALLEDVNKLRQQADVVVMSIHWGIHFEPAAVAMYKKEVGYAAIDAGVDVIFGNHPHILKGIDVYKGKVIFHSMGNFGFDQPLLKLPPDPSRPASAPAYQTKYWWGEADPDYPTYKFPPDSRKTLVAKCVIRDQQIQRVSYFPATINREGQPIILRAGDKRSDDVVAYISRISKGQNLAAEMAREGDEIVIRT